MNEADALEQTDTYRHTHTSTQFTTISTQVQHDPEGILKMKITFPRTARAPVTIISLFFHTPS